MNDNDTDGSLIWLTYWFNYKLLMEIYMAYGRFLKREFILGTSYFAKTWICFSVMWLNISYSCEFSITFLIIQLMSIRMSKPINYQWSTGEHLHVVGFEFSPCSLALVSNFGLLYGELPMCGKLPQCSCTL